MYMYQMDDGPSRECVGLYKEENGGRPEGHG